MLEKIKNYSNLVVLPHSVFALPFALASLLVATQGKPPLRILFWVIVCMVLARTAAMAYNRLIDAKEAERPALERAFKEDLKRRIDETAKYIQTNRGTLDQALMFIPSEAIYYDLLANKVGAAGVSGRNLMQYAAKDKRVTIVGPSTLSAMLQVIVQGLRSIEIQKDTDKIRKNIEQLSKHLLAHNGYMQKLGSSLGTTVGHFNTTYKELGKIDKDIVKIADAEPTVEPMLLNRPDLDE